MGENPEKDEEELIQRSRTMTEKGQEYTKNIKHAERDRILKILAKEIENSSQVTNECDDQVTIRSAYSAWMTQYETLLYVNDKYQGLLTFAGIEG